MFRLGVIKFRSGSFTLTKFFTEKQLIFARVIKHLLLLLLAQNTIFVCVFNLNNNPRQNTIQPLKIVYSK